MFVPICLFSKPPCFYRLSWLTLCVNYSCEAILLGGVHGAHGGEPVDTKSAGKTCMQEEKKQSWGYLLGVDLSPTWNRVPFKVHWRRERR